MMSPLAAAAEKGDYFITVGNTRVIRKNISKEKDGAVLANAGHFDVEISKPDLKEISIEHGFIKPGIEEYKLGNGTRVISSG